METSGGETAALELWNKYVEDSNAEFSAATREQKRVMVATDTLKQLEMGRIKPRSIYFALDNRPTDEDVEIRDLLKANTSCYVCGIGALFVSAVQRLDAISMRQYHNHRDVQTTIRDYMETHDLFDYDELAMIENYFEGWQYNTTKIMKMRYIMEFIISLNGAPFGKNSTAFDEFMWGEGLAVRRAMDL